MGIGNEWKGNNKYDKSGFISERNIDLNIMGIRNKRKGNNK